MKASLSWFIGLRYHRVDNGNGFVSFISASSTIGIMLGVAVLILGLSVMNGFERELTQRFLAIISHGELEAVDQPMLDPELRLRQAQKHGSVLGAAPYIAIQGLAQKGKKMKALNVKGVSPEQEQFVSDLPKYVDPMAWQQLQEALPQVILGQGVAIQLDAEVGDYITLLLPKDSGGKLSVPQRVRMKVIGLMKAGGQLDNQLAFVNIEYARQLQGWQEGVSGISLRVVDPLVADMVIRDIANTYPQIVFIKSWNRTHGYLYQDIQLVRTVMYAIMLLIVAVASFNIVSTLVLAVSDKQGDIAILKTMGMSDGSLIRTFIVYGSYNGIMGCILGTLLGLGGVMGLPKLMQIVEGLMGRKVLSADIYFIDFLPVMLKWQDVGLVIAAALVLSVSATLWPAWQAAKVQPARVLGG